MAALAASTNTSDVSVEGIRVALQEVESTDTPVVSEDVPVKPSFAEFKEQLLAGQFTNIIVLCGAGASTRSGIPDYRSKSGLYGPSADVKKYFSRSHYLYKNDFETIAAGAKGPNGPKGPNGSLDRKHGASSEYNDEKFLAIGKSFTDKEPCAAHRFVVELHKKGWLRRCYSQNIDGLLEKAGLPADKLVNAHGSFADKSVVLYGDGLPDRFYTMAHKDFKPIEDNKDNKNNKDNNSKPIDCVIVIGSSLQVNPFRLLFNMVPHNCTRVLVDLDPDRVDWQNRDLFLDRFAHLAAYRSPVQSPLQCHYHAKVSFSKTFPKVLCNNYLGNSLVWKTQFVLAMDCCVFAEHFLPPSQSNAKV